MFFPDLNRRHGQFSEWVRRGIVPDPSSEPLVGRGQLTSVWLGGLANPGALMMSLRHEKAAMQGCAVDEVNLYIWGVGQRYATHRDFLSTLREGTVYLPYYKNCIETPCFCPGGASLFPSSVPFVT